MLKCILPRTIQLFTTLTINICKADIILLKLVFKHHFEFENWVSLDFNVMRHLYCVTCVACLPLENGVEKEKRLLSQSLFLQHSSFFPGHNSFIRNNRDHFLNHNDDLILKLALMLILCLKLVMMIIFWILQDITYNIPILYFATAYACLLSWASDKASSLNDQKVFCRRYPYQKIIVK